MGYTSKKKGNPLKIIGIPMKKIGKTLQRMGGTSKKKGNPLKIIGIPIKMIGVPINFDPVCQIVTLP